MRKPIAAVALTAVVATALVLLVILPTGCAKPPPESAQNPAAPASMPAKNAAPTAQAEAPAAVSTPATPEKAAPAANVDMAFLLAARKNLRSYIETVSVGGRTIHHAVDLKDGKPLRMRIDTGQAGQYVLVLTDEHVTYLVDTERKTAIKMPMSARAEAGMEGAGKSLPRGEAAPTLSELGAQHPKVTSGSLDGTDCWKVETTDSKGKPMVTWVDKQYGLVRESTADGKTVKFAYDKVNGVPASEFELPKGLKVMAQPQSMNPHMPMGHPGSMVHGMPAKPPAPGKP